MEPDGTRSFKEVSPLSICRRTGTAGGKNDAPLRVQLFPFLNLRKVGQAIVRGRTDKSPIKFSETSAGLLPPGAPGLMRGYSEG